jgi:dTMP kinase
MRGKFLVIDGIDGAGKSTALKSITDLLKEKDIPFLVTREPGGTPLAEEIREMVLSVREEKVCENSELLLMFAARAQHLSEKIIPALESGVWIVSDRFTSTTKAYQGSGRGLNMKHINMLETMVQGTLRPDMTFVLDLDPEIGKSRTRARGDENRLDQETKDFMTRCREGFQAQARQEPDRFRMVDADQSPDSVCLDLRDHLEAILESDPVKSKDDQEMSL